MLAIQSGIAKHHCLYTQGAVAFQTSGGFLTHPVYRYHVIRVFIFLFSIEFVSRRAFVYEEFKWKLMTFYPKPTMSSNKVSTFKLKIAENFETID